MLSGTASGNQEALRFQPSVVKAMEGKGGSALEHSVSKSGAKFVNNQQKGEIRLMEKEKRKKTADMAKVGKESSQTVPEPKPEPKDVEIPILNDIIIRPPDGNGYTHFLRVPGEEIEHFAMYILEDLFKDADCAEMNELREYLIQILEEEFGMNIRICGYCKYFEYSGAKPAKHIATGEEMSTITGTCYKKYGKTLPFRRFFGDKCECEFCSWSPKEIPPEKKEEEKTCGNCGRRVINKSYKMGNSPDYVCEEDDRSHVIREFPSFEDVSRSKPCDRWILDGFSKRIPDSQSK